MYGKVNMAGLTPAQRTEANFKMGIQLFQSEEVGWGVGEVQCRKIQNSEFTPAANYYAGFIELGNGRYDEAYIDLKRAETTHPMPQ